MIANREVSMTEINTVEAQFLHRLVTESTLKDYFEAQSLGITDDAFTDEITQKTWAFIKEHITEYSSFPDLRTVQEQIPDFRSGETPERIEFYRDRLMRQFQKQQMGNFALELAQMVQSDRVERSLEYIGETYNKLIKGAKISDYGRFRDMSDRIDSYIQKKAAGESPMGIPTGIKELDDHFLGFRPGDYAVISGRPGEGKTTTCLYFAFSAFMAGYKVSYIVLEMPREQIFEKLDALATGISVNKIKRLSIPDGDMETYQERAREIASHESDIHVHDRTGDCSLITIEAILNQDEPDILFVDPIYLMKQQKGANEWQSIKRNSNAIKAMAMQYRTPIVVASQINRAGGESVKMGESPSLESLAYSDALGQDADHAFALTGNSATRANQAKRLSSVKLRGASPKDIVVKWDPTTNNIAYLCEYKDLKVDKDTQEVLDLQKQYSQEAQSPEGPLG